MLSPRTPRGLLRQGFKHVSLRHGVLASVLVLCLLAIFLTAQEIWTARIADLHVSSLQTINLAQSLSQQTTDSFQTVDAVLDDMVERAESDGTQPQALPRIRRVMRQDLRHLRVVHNIFIFDADGNGLVDGLPGWMQANVRDRPYFIFHRTHPSRGTHIGHTVQSRTDGSWIITVTRRLNHADGSFAGVAMASIPANYFLHLYQHVDIGRSGIITLALADGTILMRKPFERSNIGKSIAASPSFQANQKQFVAGNYEYHSVVDGVERLFAFHRVSQYPLLVVVGVGKDESLGDWRVETMVRLIELVVSLFIMVVLGGYLAGQVSKREAAEAQLERLVLVDGLTGLGNRHQFDAVLAREWRRAARAGTPLSFLMIDADKFKDYNDHYGHQAGDNVLKSIAGCIAGALGRPADLAARYGGEEFAVFLPETNFPGAHKVAEIIRRSVVALNIPHVGTPSGVVTVSIGVGQMSPNGSTPSSALVKAADAALYEAKDRGRNRTEPAASFLPTVTI